MAAAAAAAALSVSVSVSPNPGTVNQPVTFSCNASGGTPPYYVPVAVAEHESFRRRERQQTYTTSSATPTTISAGCTVTDSAALQGSNATTVRSTLRPVRPRRAWT